MEILVCIKRVPTVGGRIAVTADGQEVDTRASGFSISPHEECAVEEAVQITERDGGSVSVLTLGPEAAIEQLRGALALGAHRAVLLETDGREFGPIATAAAIAAEVRAGRVRPGAAGQRGGRHRRLPGRRPARARARLAGRHRDQEPGSSRTAASWRAGSTAAWRRRTRCRCRPWSRSRRASTCRATRRCPGGCGPSAPRSTGPRPSGRPKGCANRRCACRESGKHQAEVLGEGVDAVPVAGPRPGGMGVLS